MSMYLRKKEGTSSGTIVMVHSNSASSKLFDLLFASEAFNQTLLAPDLPGHGKSLNGFGLRDYSFTAYRQMIIDLINTIDDEILLVGISLGGHLIIETLDEINNIEKVKGIVLSGAPPIGSPNDIPEAFIINELLGIFTTENPNTETINNTFDSIIVGSRARQEIKKDFISSDPKVRLASAESFRDPSILKDEIKLLSDFNGEKLVIQGSKDPMINQRYLEKLAQDELFDLKIMENCGHYPCLEVSKEYINHVKDITNCFNR